MSDDPLDLDALTDEEAFNAALTALIRAAHENDVELERFYVCQNDGLCPDYEVEIVEVQKPPEVTPTN